MSEVRATRARRWKRGGGAVRKRGCVFYIRYNLNGRRIEESTEAANITEARVIPGKRVPHDFRRTAARSYRRSGVSEGVVMKILGHKTRSMFERYNIKNEDDLREAANAVAQQREDRMGQNGANGALVVPITTQPKSVSS